MQLAPSLTIYPRTPTLAEALDYATLWFAGLGHPIHPIGSLANPRDLTRTVLFRFIDPTSDLPDSAPQRMTIWQEADSTSGAISLYGEW